MKRDLGKMTITANQGQSYNKNKQENYRSTYNLLLVRLLGFCQWWTRLKKILRFIEPNTFKT